MEYKLDELSPVTGQRVDVEKHEGAKVVLEKVGVIDVNTEWDNTKYPPVRTPGITRPWPYLKVETAPLEKFTKTDGDVKEIRASEIFKLRKTKEGKIEWPTHSNSNIQKLFKKFAVNKPAELIGKTVVACVRVNNKGKFLGFNY